MACSTQSFFPIGAGFMQKAGGAFLYWPIAFEFHNSVPTLLSPGLGWVACYTINQLIYQYYLSSKTVQRKTGEPRGKPQKKYLGYLFSLYNPYRVHPYLVVSPSLITSQGETHLANKKQKMLQSSKVSQPYIKSRRGKN